MRSGLFVRENQYLIVKCIHVFIQKIFVELRSYAGHGGRNSEQERRRGPSPLGACGLSPLCLESEMGPFAGESTCS